MSLILGYITTLEIEMLERTSSATITEKPAGDGVVSFALVFERDQVRIHGNRLFVAFDAESSLTDARLQMQLISLGWTPPNAVTQVVEASTTRAPAHLHDALTTVAPIVQGKA